MQIPPTSTPIRPPPTSSEPPSSAHRQPKAAGVLLMGTGGRINPNSVEYMETACTIQEDKVIHPFAFRTHTHALGQWLGMWVCSGAEGIAAAGGEVYSWEQFW